MEQQVREVKLAYIKSTPGTHVFGTAEKGVVCKQVYLARDVMTQPPSEITLTVKWEV